MSDKSTTLVSYFYHSLEEYFFLSSDYCDHTSYSLEKQVILLLVEPINEKIAYYFLPMWQLCFYQLVLKEYEQCYWVLLINMKYITNTNILT